jgi:hypothetical protein
MGRSRSYPVEASAAESDRFGVDTAAHEIDQFLSIDRLLLEEEVDDGAEGHPTFCKDRLGPLRCF